MTRPYPLYDELTDLVTKREEKAINIEQIRTTIINISQTMSAEEAMKHYYEIAALILHHETLHNGGLSLTPLPYESKVIFGGKGILHNITNLPPNLQQILAQYIEETSKDKSCLNSLSLNN